MSRQDVLWEGRKADGLRSKRLAIGGQTVKPCGRIGGRDIDEEEFAGRDGCPRPKILPGGQVGRSPDAVGGIGIARVAELEATARIDIDGGVHE
jgi:hypothetical protein